jgi:enoyl-CoA hydratase/carnithine racemase
MPIHGPEIVLYEVVDGVATITINREERMNALSTETWDLLDETWRKFDREPDARVAILTGAGSKSFSAGGDLKEFAERGVKRLDDSRKYGARYPSASYSWEVSKPVIAAVNGFALAGGFLLAQRCDLRIAADTAVFGITEVKVSRAAPWAVPLVWALPSAVALELLLTGDRFSAQRMYEVGFVNRVVPADRLMSTARSMAVVIRDNAPLSVAAHKRLFYTALDTGMTVGSMLADEICKAVYESEDCQEGQRAFKDKRAPVWTGR